MKPYSWGERSGISMEYTRSTGRLYVSGWYDSMVGIEGRGYTLADWAYRLGIRPCDLRAAASEYEVWERAVKAAEAAGGSEVDDD